MYQKCNDCVNVSSITSGKPDSNEEIYLKCNKSHYFVRKIDETDSDLWAYGDPLGTLVVAGIVDCENYRYKSKEQIAGIVIINGEEYG